MTEINEQRLLNTFFDLIRIYSPSGRERNVRAYIQDYLSDLSLDYKIDDFGNLIIYLPGKGESIVYLAHMDNVEPCNNVDPVVENGIIKSRGKTILGADMKAGIAAILEAVKHLKENNLEHRTVEMVFTREEEIGLKGAQRLNFNLLKSKKAVLFDGVGPLGSIAQKEAGASIVEISIKGKASHSGVIEKGAVSAIKIAGEIISSLPFGKARESTNFDIGLISGGQSVNTIAEKARMKGVIRSLNPAQEKVLMEEIAAKVKRIAANHGVSANVKLKEVAGYHAISPISGLVKSIIVNMKGLDIKPSFYDDMSSSEASVLSKKGIEAVNLGYGGEKDHTIEEKIKVEDLILMTKLLINISKC